MCIYFGDCLGEINLWRGGERKRKGQYRQMNWGENSMVKTKDECTEEAAHNFQVPWI